MLSEDSVSGMTPWTINHSDEFWSNIYAKQVLWLFNPHPPQPLFLTAVIFLWPAKSSFLQFVNKPWHVSCPPTFGGNTHKHTHTPHHIHTMHALSLYDMPGTVLPGGD